MKKLSLPNGVSKWSCQMGRRNKLPENPNATIKLRLERIVYRDHAYDKWGAYWGIGDASVWCAWGEDEETQVRVFCRAAHLAEAQCRTKRLVPAAVFDE